MARKLIDLTTPIQTNHFRWPVERKLVSSHAQRDLAEVTWIGMAVHGFTHMDAGSHFVEGAYTTDEVGLEQITGRAAVIDLSEIEPNSAVTAQMLQAGVGDIEPGMIALMRTCWDERRSLDSPEFWTDAPYMTTEACRWLLAKGISAIAFDFPQDRCIRDMVTGFRQPTLEENTTHVELLLKGVPMFEYICNTGALSQSEVEFIGLPIKLPGSDGAPARVIAIEN